MVTNLTWLPADSIEAIGHSYTFGHGHVLGESSNATGNTAARGGGRF